MPGSWMHPITGFPVTPVAARRCVVAQPGKPNHQFTPCVSLHRQRTGELESACESVESSTRDDQQATGRPAGDGPVTTVDRSGDESLDRLESASTLWRCIDSMAVRRVSEEGPGRAARLSDQTAVDSASCAIARSSRSARTGLVNQRSTPVSTPESYCSRPLTPKTFNRSKTRSWRIARIASAPPISGMFMSIKTMSGCSF